MDNLKTVSVTYSNNENIVTSVNGSLTDKEIRNYFAVGKTFNIGSGENDLLVKVKEVKIIKKLETNLKKWYKVQYPTDELGNKLNHTISLDWLSRNIDGTFYERIGVSDSLVRERIFKKLSEMTGKSYDVFYHQWLKN